MKISEELTNYLIDQLSSAGHFTPRTMFGCRALFFKGLMVILVDSLGDVYVKTDEISRTRFNEVGYRPFTYTRHGPNGVKTVQLSYAQLPDCALEEQELLISWVKSGIEAARRASRCKITSSFTDISDE